ncbi:MAG: hypothetical protein AB1Z23_01235 [Eubacteriales bacterium]
MNNKKLLIPTHIKEFYKNVKGDEFSTEGDLLCTCGHYKFSILLGADLSGEYIGTIEYKGDYYLIVYAVCGKCGKEVLIFDNNQHGWDGFVCSNTDKTEYPKNEFKPLPQDDFVKIKLMFQGEGIDDFINETDGEFPKERWVDGFGWFAMSICESKEFKEIISFETM